MDRGAWWATVHAAAQISDTAEATEHSAERLESGQSE